MSTATQPRTLDDLLIELGSVQMIRDSLQGKLARTNTYLARVTSRAVAMFREHKLSLVRDSSGRVWQAVREGGDVAYILRSRPIEARDFGVAPADHAPADPVPPTLEPDPRGGLAHAPECGCVGCVGIDA